jgi:hypothetical protein
MNFFFFSFASVSKSLLTVLGTLSLPAKNDREQHRTAGINRSRGAWSSQRTRLAHASRRPCTSMFDLPAVLTYLHARARRGTCGHTPRTSRFPCSSRAHPSMMSHRLFYVLLGDHPANCTVRRFALVKAHANIPLPVL